MINDFSLQDSINIYFTRKKNSPFNDKIINRRRAKMLQMIKDNSGYFSLDNIKKEEPILYEIYLGQSKEKNYNTFSGFLLNQIDNNDFKENLEKQIRQEAQRYGTAMVYQEYSKLIESEKKNTSHKDNLKELIDIMAIKFLFSNKTFDCDNDSDLDNDKSNEEYDEEEFFNRDDEDDYT